MRERLISDAAASAWMLRQWLAHDAARAATLVIWNAYTEAEALEELLGLGRMADIRCRRLDCSSDAVAREMFADELHRQRWEHRQTEKAISAAVLAALRQGESREQAAAVAGHLARMARLAPPPWVVVSAMECVNLQLGLRRRAA